MRVLILTFAAAAGAALAFAADTDRFEHDTARPGGVYTTLPRDDASACAQACADDALCMAWTYRSAGACELKAVITPAQHLDGAISGLSERAPAFARVRDHGSIPPAAPAAAQERSVNGAPSLRGMVAEAPIPQREPDIAEGLAGGPIASPR